MEISSSFYFDEKDGTCIELFKKNKIIHQEEYIPMCMIFQKHVHEKFIPRFPQNKKKDCILFLHLLKMNMIIYKNGSIFISIFTFKIILFL